MTAAHEVPCHHRCFSAGFVSRQTNDHIPLPVNSVFIDIHQIKPFCNQLDK